MTKEKFIYELIDNWLYLISQHNVLMENYTQKDRTEKYNECCVRLAELFDFYDQIYEKVDQEKYSDEIIDANLQMVIQGLKNETTCTIINEIKNELCINIENKEKFINDYLLVKKRGKTVDVDKNLLIKFISELRKSEEDMWK